MSLSCWELQSSMLTWRLSQVEGSEWWKGRTREGREGWFPKKWVQVLERRKPAENPEGKKVE